MGVLKTITNEYFGEEIRKEDEIEIGDLDVEIVSFTDMNGKFHGHGYRVKDNGNPVGMSNTLYWLIEIIKDKRGTECDLNDIDVSNIEKTNSLFYYSDFNGDISGWNVSNVENMFNMFNGSKFTGENGIFRLEQGNKVKNMENMFYNSEFNGDVENWKVNKICVIDNMFYYTPLEKNNNLPQWYLDRQ